MYSAQQYSSIKGAFRHVQNTAEGHSQRSGQAQGSVVGSNEVRKVLLGFHMFVDEAVQNISLTECKVRLGTWDFLILSQI
jgi:hypothetical protein